MAASPLYSESAETLIEGEQKITWSHGFNDLGIGAPGASTPQLWSIEIVDRDTAQPPLILLRDVNDLTIVWEWANARNNDKITIVCRAYLWPSLNFPADEILRPVVGSGGVGTGIGAVELFLDFGTTEVGPVAGPT